MCSDKRVWAGDPFSLTPVGRVHSIFKKKFGIPRQAGIIPEATATIELLAPFNNEQMVRGLEGFSHVWVLFVFHDSAAEGWKTTVRPPRLGGQKKVGVFASRSPFRPNPIGMSAVELEEISFRKGKVFLHVKGVDLLHDTPVIDIKPYLPYSDSLSHAAGGYAQEPPGRKFDIHFSCEAEKMITLEEENGVCGLRSLIVKMLAGDPRPAYYLPRHSKARFAITLMNLDIKWSLEGDRIVVNEVVKLK
ncbi:MAG: tRNA (N6-threonylcarbamoyladenosine(37)-N6)-methyltransferase TrmO [Deltaproteobacteria bacterium]|nr:tRNA (N6-threonylcarbamoyladenosine(37)-N6)-methyltransferase TrmO [Deltaproteobacteria bacterium]